MEVWKDIKCYEGLYQVSNKGNIRRIKFVNRMVTKEKITYLKLNKNTGGYLSVVLYKNGTHKRYLVHRLVAQAFIENIENKIEVNHIDGNKLNNHVSNLEWVTRSENMKHSYSMGLEKPPMKGRFGKLNSISKPILQYDLNNNFIRRFESVGEGARFLRNKSADRSISKCCNGLRKTAYGYIWRFENE